MIEHSAGELGVLVDSLSSLELLTPPTVPVSVLLDTSLESLIFCSDSAILQVTPDKGKLLGMAVFDEVDEVFEVELEDNKTLFAELADVNVIDMVVG